MIEETEKRLKEYEICKKSADIFFNLVEGSIKKLSIDDVEFEKDVEIACRYLMMLSFVMHFPEEVVPRILELNGMITNLLTSYKIMQTLTHPEKE